MDATQMIIDSISESDEEEIKETNENKKGRPLAKLCILKNEHIPVTELPLFLGDNVVGRDPNTCSLPLTAPSISKQHAIISLSVYRKKGPHNEVDIEALIWDLGSMNGTRKGHFKLTPNVRYALSECDSLVVADIPCQYVSRTIDTVSSKGYTMTPVSRNSGVNARLPDASREKGGDTSTGSQKCVNGASKSRVSLPGQEDTRKTPVRTSCLSFEKTPTQPQGTLVPESDSDSDEERGERRRKTPVSDSDSNKSGPTCSTFLSPTNKIVPESEDESPITLSSSTKNRPSRHVSFSKEEPDVEMGQQQLKNKKTLTIVADSDEEEERAALEERNSEEREQHVPRKQESNVSLTGEDEMPVFSPAVLTDAIPVFDMDSDTDMEGEEEMVAPAGPVTLNTNQQADQPPNTAQFHMDSDSDVDENELHEVPKSVPSSADHAKPPHVISIIQAEGITMDSDTDVDDDDVSDVAIKAKPTPLQSTHATDSDPSTQRNDFHPDSDTDIDEEEEKPCGTNNSCSKIDETPTRLDIKPTGPESAPAAPHSLNLDSDTDEEDDSSLLIPVVVSTLSVDPGTTSEALLSDSDADTDVDESSVPPAGDGVNPAVLRVDSDIDVEDKEMDFGEGGENQIPSLHREITPGLLVPLQQNCSTPVQVLEGELEDMETQAFLIPSSGPFRRARPIKLSPCTDSLEDDLCVVAETQSFILQTRDCQGNPPEDHNKGPTQSSVDEKGEQCIRERSFQLGLSDSSHLEGQAQALAMESTQAFVSVLEGANLEDTQAYADRTSLENDSNLQAYGEDEEPTRCQVMSKKEGRVDLALEATQAYISEANSDSEVDEDERKNTATAETQPFHLPTSSTLAMAETQPMFALEEEDEESLDEENPISSLLQVKSSPQHVTEEREEHVEAAQPQKRHLRGALSVAETQTMHVSENEESDDKGLIPRRRRAKPQQLEEEQTQTLTNSEFLLVETQPMHIGVAETQPMATSGNEESDVEDLIPGPRKRKAKQQWLEDEQTQTLTNSELSTVETQPMDTGEDGESDEEDWIPGPQKRRAKPLQLEEETQPLTSSGVSVVETQPLGTCISDQSVEEVSTPGPRKRKAKARQLEEEETQPLTISDVSAVETQPMVVSERRKRRAKPIQEEDMQPLTNPEASAVETKTVRQSQRGKGSQTETGTSGMTIGGRRRTRSRLREEAEQAECSEPSKRPTRGKMKALPTTRGRRGKSRPDEEEEEVEQAKRARGKKYTRHQKEGEEEEEMLETERNNAENNNLIKEQEKRREEQDKLEREIKDKEEQERVQAENAERFRLEQERAEKERIEREKKEADEKKRADKAQEEERLERERKEKEEKERLEREKIEREEKERIEKEREKEEKLRLEREKTEREEKGRIEKERKKEEKERLDCEKTEREEKERIEKEREKEEKERLEREKAEREEKERIEKERKKERKKEEKLRLEREKAEREEKERIEKEKKKEEKLRLEREKSEKKEKERIEKERKKEEKLRLEREKTEREEKERIEKERKKEEKLRLEREKAEREEKERIEKERKKEEKLRLEREKAEREEKEREEKERTEKERKKEEKERLKTAKKEREEIIERERKEQEEKQEKEAKEREAKEQQENKKKENDPKTPAKGRRAAPCTTEPHQDSTILAIDDVPARRTRSRSNSSNSVSSERSACSESTQGSRGRGRGRAAKRTSGPPQAAVARSSNRRRTVAAQPTQQDSYDISPQGVLSRSNSTGSEMSSCSLSSRSGGRGGRQRGRGRKTESDSIPPFNSGQNLAPKPTTRGRKGWRAEDSSNEVPHDHEKDKTDSQQASTTRGRQRANANDSTPSAGDKKSPSSLECASEDSPLLKRNVRGRGPKMVKSETVETPVAPAVSDGEEAKGKRNGRKRELEANTDEDASCSSKISKVKEKAQTTEAAKGETKDESRVQVKRKGRASSAQAKKNAKDSSAESEVMEESEKMEAVTVERRGRGQPSVVQKLKKEKQEESGASFDQDPHLEESKPQTPTSSVSRKRQALVDSSPVAKTRRASSASPAAGGQLQAARQAYKVLFTGVVDEEGERVLARLGGSMAKGVADMNFLVTDKVRRTVKFLCAVSKGVPIVNTHWLNESGKAGSFLSPNAFVVKDPEQEKKFNFCLQESLRIARSQSLLQGYEIHVTKSVKPEPVHMKDIISCSGATFLPKMPSSHKPQTIVISCEEDWLLCGPALSESLPVVTAEFILTGILRQKLDLQTHKLSAPANTLQLAGGRGRSKKKT